MYKINQKWKIIKYLFLLTSLFTLSLHAQTLLITDKSNYSLLINNPTIYYSSKQGSGLSLFYKPDMQKNGLRIKQGMGQTSISWSDIQTITFGKLKEDGTILANIKVNNISSSLTLLNPIGGLEANSSLGKFSIVFEDIKSIDIASNKHIKEVVLTIEKFTKTQNKALPNSVKIDNEKNLISFVSKELKAKKDDLKVEKYGQYILIYVKNYNNTLIIDSLQSTYAVFNNS